MPPPLSVLHPTKSLPTNPEYGSTLPPLKSSNVIDALRLPAFQPVEAAKDKVADVIDLTEEEEEDRVTYKQTQNLPPLKPLDSFAPSAGSWSCDICLVSNKPSDDKCIACGAERPGIKPPVVHAPPTDGVHLNNSGSLKFGSSELKVASHPFMTSTPIGGIQLLNSTMKEQSKKGEQKPTPIFGAAGGLKLCIDGGLTLGGSAHNALSSSSSMGGGLTLSGMVGGSSMASKTLKLGSIGEVKITGAESSTKGSGVHDTSAEGLKFGRISTSSKEQVEGENIMAKFAPPPGAWSCDVCMVANKEDAEQCIACSSPKPVEKYTGKPREVQQHSTLCGGIQFGSKDSGLVFRVKSTSASQPTEGIKLGGMNSIRVGGNAVPQLPPSASQPVGGATIVRTDLTNKTAARPQGPLKFGSTSVTATAAVPTLPQQSTLAFSSVPGNAVLKTNQYQ